MNVVRKRTAREMEILKSLDELADDERRAIDPKELHALYAAAKAEQTPCSVGQRQWFEEMQEILQECVAELGPNYANDWKKLAALQPVLLPQRPGGRRLSPDQLDQEREIRREGKAVRKEKGRDAAIAHMEKRFLTAGRMLSETFIGRILDSKPR